MQTSPFDYGPRQLHLYLSGTALFRIQALAPAPEGDTPAPDVLDLILSNTADGNHILCQTAQILAEAGELCRRYLGYEEERIPSPEELEAILSPKQILLLRGVVLRTMDAGFGEAGQSGQDADIDLGLLELEKKTKPLPRLTI